jgi:hypothetical protein
VRIRGRRRRRSCAASSRSGWRLVHRRRDALHKPDFRRREAHLHEAARRELAALGSVSAPARMTTVPSTPGNCPPLGAPWTRHRGRIASGGRALTKGEGTSTSPPRWLLARTSTLKRDAAPRIAPSKVDAASSCTRLTSSRTRLASSRTRLASTPTRTASTSTRTESSLTRTASTSLDAASIPVDAGSTAVDAESVPLDAGSTALDAESVRVDAGSTALDSESVRLDAESIPRDARRAGPQVASIVVHRAGPLSIG